MNVCIIPARGGSKRIPGKNLKRFNGAPIITYAIATARQSGLFDRVLVSTDCEDIASVARDAGAEVPFVRPAEIAGDHATTLDVLEHAIQWLNQSPQHKPLHAVCCLYATTPFVTTDDLRQGLALLDGDTVKYSFAATRYAFPIQRSIHVDADGSVSMLWPEHFTTRSQDLQPAYHDAGMFYWGTPSAFLAREPVFAPHSKAVLIPHYRVQDIDEPDDWLRAELMYQLLEQQALL
ncbi:pseudaminic acid cytidylyltransferase [Salinivibrio sp. ES.052]|uniref:pseudaminic acid cytidylyltransferase n=1 Tax=Salinivibrio sp. ES.052 TaxID=1882823 RepID=UPI000927912C|nr:pseudaminic acid cytidylyltransferase [Salinivibrio sp. ES.052]SIN78233.1 N-acylneuraminate cytidylyltransferase [Salinivibrio sp. ES.052]